MHCRLFNTCNETPALRLLDFDISLSDFRDLLSKDGEKLDIKINPDGTGQLHVPGLRIIEVKSFQHIKKVMQ